MFNPNSVATTLDKLGVPVPAALETVRAIRLAIGEAATHDYVGDLRAEITAGKVTPKNAKREDRSLRNPVDRAADSPSGVA